MIGTKVRFLTDSKNSLFLSKINYMKIKDLGIVKRKKYIKCI